MKKYLCNFMPHDSTNLVDQSDIIQWLIQHHGSEHRDSFQKYAVKPEYIRARMVYAPGVAETPAAPCALYDASGSTRPDVLFRSEIAQEVLRGLFSDLYVTEGEPPAYLNHVSCTHYHSPSAAQQLVVEKGWHERTRVRHLYQMGCYAAFPALNLSCACVEDGAERVDVVHTELCSFHLDREQVTPDQIIMKTLFGDGAIRYSLVNEEYFNKTEEKGYEVMAQHEVLVPETDQEMSWKVGPHGFVMKLTKGVPVYLGRKIESFMRTLFSEAGLNYDRDKPRTLFAIHPGGPKIVESIQRVLELSDEQVQHALDILEQRGNMSSATIPYIWNHIVNDVQTVDELYVASVAFGPGLTMTGAILKLCRS